MTPPAELLGFLKNEDDFLIATHLNPDGDGLGSALALSMALQAMGKKTALLCRDQIPKICRFLPDNEKFNTFETLLSQGRPRYDFKNLILVDCNDVDRITNDKTLASKLSFEKSVVIDHHETEKDFGDLKWISHDSPATAVMVYHIVKGLGITITKDIAVNLYAGIAVDTGNFRHDNTSADALRIAADLVEAGAKPAAIYRELFESWSSGRFNLFTRALGALQTNDGIAVTVITGKMFEETSSSADDTENFVEFPRIVKDIKVSLLLREVDEKSCKVSLRSKGDINVAKIAAEFGGGGHKNAAGCTIKANVEIAKAKLLSKIKDIL